MAKQAKQNPVLKKTVRKLRETAKEYDAPIWDDVADALTKPARSMPRVNLAHLDKHVEENEKIVVPGKVLGAGRITKPVTVAAFQFSTRAHKQISDEGRAVKLLDFIEDNKHGRNVRIIK